MLASVALSSIYHFVTIEPLRASTQSVLPKSMYGVYVNLSSSLLIMFGLIFLIAILRSLWKHRTDSVYFFLILAAFLICSTPFKIVHLFSSRYTGTAIPLLLLVTDRYNSNESFYWRIARLLCGAFVGWYSLRSFYWSN
jgi:hypothetical protein